jgi:hypothetical protein
MGNARASVKLATKHCVILALWDNHLSMESGLLRPGRGRMVNHFFPLLMSPPAMRWCFVTQ